MANKMLMMMDDLLNACKYYIRSLKHSGDGMSKYRILMSKDKLNESFVKLNISIMDKRYIGRNDEKKNKQILNNNFYGFEHHIILTEDLANEFIYKILYDFNSEKSYGYASINSLDRVLTVRDFDLEIERNYLELQIKLDSEEDLYNAQQILAELNKVITKNMSI